ncbi:MAG: aldehyde ferredoxin oxidoreductase family protein [Deltaproteobacteria bacterium]|nr:aldehyde ferredoxin oxidoreductase family protein [Deltaproteobacteria bacterium]
MKGYMNTILRINANLEKHSVETLNDSMKRDFVGGRGFVIKILWDEVKQVDPMSPDNKLVFALGPLSGQPIPSSSKMVIGTKSPLHGGYVDANIGGRAPVYMKQAGYDILILEGRASTPKIILIDEGRVQFLDAGDLWGLDTYKTQDMLEERFSKKNGMLLIGPAGEKGVSFSCIMSQKGRAAGRGGVGAVMGSKNIKAIIFSGSKKSKIADPDKLNQLGRQGYSDIQTKDSFDIWTRQGTMMVIDWANSIGGLPTNNFRQGSFEYHKGINGEATEAIKIGRQGCSKCNCRCGIVVRDEDGGEAELDYENIALLGSNLGINGIKKASALNRIADEIGVDTISLGNALGFLMEASQNGLTEEKLEWGDFDGCKKVIRDLVENVGLGAVIFNGVKIASERLGGESYRYAMHIKGMEISGYTCQGLPGMALAYGTSPIGAHHKDAFLTAWELPNREKYTRDKVEKCIELQNLRGGLFEVMTVCRFPWVELGFGVEWYPKFLEACTGEAFPKERIDTLGDRLYSLMRAFWVRETKNWNRSLDTPPDRWFDDAFSGMEWSGMHLDREKYDQLLTNYYDLRGWDQNGRPKPETMEMLGLV